ncbi:MAG: NAD(P)/FAD-dependent oxidoreductase [Bacteriovoracaceae bacterium]|jgi:thioredoxin reductase (NADPH)|nr:NAD(P)/FAD-dependent oxidoreductase [Bacteriovoracaceae bacterium]
MEKIYPVCVIGGGAAGTMAVIRAVLNNDETLFFPGTAKHKKKSRAFWVSKVENMPAHLDFKKGIEEPNKLSLEWLNQSDFKEKLHWKKNQGVEKISKNSEGVFEITATDGQVYLSQYVVLCTGVMDVQPLINNSIQPILPYANVQLADYCLRCDGHHVLHKKVGVIGHDSSAMWVAIMLRERYDTQCMVVFTNGKNAQFDEETTKLQKLYGIQVIEEAITGIEGNAKLNSLTHLKLETENYIEVEYIFISLGMIVYNELAKSLGAELDSRGFVVTDNKGKTSIAGLYVAGDLRANAKKQIYTAWDHAVDSCDDINVLLRREKRLKLLGQ